MGIDALGMVVHKYTDWYTDFSVTDSVLMSIWKRVTEGFIMGTLCFLLQAVERHHFYPMKPYRMIPFALAFLLAFSACLYNFGFAGVLPKGDLVSLSGSTQLAFPEALLGKNTLIAMGFHPRHQSTLEKGLLLFDGLQSGPARLQIVEIAVIEPRYKAFDASIKTFMRKTVSNKTLMGRIYPFYADSKQLKTALGFQKEDFSFVLLGPSGQVLWKKSAEPTPAMVESLRQVLLTLKN